MSRDEYISHLAGKLASDEIDFNEIRKELQTHKIGEVEMKSILRLIDKEAQRLVVTRTKRLRAHGYIVMGTLTMIAGVLSLIMFGPLFYLYGYGLCSGGLGLLIHGLAGLPSSRFATHRASRYLRDRRNI